MKYLIMLMLLLGCADSPKPTLKYSLGDVVTVKVEPFYKKCETNGRIIKYHKSLNPPYAILYRVLIKTTNNPEGCPTLYLAAEGSLTI